MKTIATLWEGYQAFHNRHFQDKTSTLYRQLATGQAPQVMVLSCSDSRVDPAHLFQSEPGDLFVLRNVANLVPPCHLADGVEHGTIAAIEYGVCYLKVRDFIILGHSQCGGIRALVEDSVPREKNSFIPDWVAIAQAARKKTLQAHAQSSLDVQCQHCEREAIAISLSNLMTYPWLVKAVRHGLLRLHGWHFTLGTGTIERLTPSP